MIISGRAERARVSTLLAVPASVVGGTTADGDDLLIELAGQVVRVRWVPVGLPAQIREALGRSPRPDVVASEHMSPGARALAEERGIGWLDSTGAAHVARDGLLVARDGEPPARRQRPTGWRRSTIGVAEALLVGVTPHQRAIAKATGLSTGSVATALRFLADEGYLTADAPVGRTSGRRLAGPKRLLDAYAEVVRTEPRPDGLRVGVLRDSAESYIEIGRTLARHGYTWACAGGLAAALMAPLVTTLSPAVIYVDADTDGALALAARESGLRVLRGGRLELVRFPTRATRALANGSNPPTAPWPRIYAELLDAGVRGADAAEHLRRVMTSSDGHDVA